MASRHCLAKPQRRASGRVAMFGDMDCPPGRAGRARRTTVQFTHPARDDAALQLDDNDVDVLVGHGGLEPSPSG